MPHIHALARYPPAATSSVYAQVARDPCSNTLSPPPPMTAPPPAIGPKVFFTTSLPNQTADAFDSVQQSVFLGLVGQYAQGEFPISALGPGSPSRRIVGNARLHCNLQAPAPPFRSPPSPTYLTGECLAAGVCWTRMASMWTPWSSIPSAPVGWPRHLASS